MMAPDRSLSRAKCSVSNCRSTRNRNPDLSFHTFPKKNKSLVEYINKCGFKEKIDRYTAWMNKLNLHKLPSKTASVCSLHFRKEDFLLPDLIIMRPRLKSTAVPSLNLPSATPMKSRRVRTEKRPISAPVQSDEFNPEEAEDCSKSSKNSKIEGVDDHIYFDEPTVEDFKNDIKFEVCYLNAEDEQSCKIKSSDYVTETDEASEGNNGLDFQHTCRICLATNNLTCLRKSQSLVTLFVNITKIEVEADDKLSKNICEDCIQKLEDISNFIVMAKKNDELQKQASIVNEESRIESLGDEDEENLRIEEENSNMSQQCSNVCTSGNNKSLTTGLSLKSKGEKLSKTEKIDDESGFKSKSKLLKQSKGEGSEIVDNERDFCNISSKNLNQNLSSARLEDQNSIQYFCRICGVPIIGVTIPKKITNVPPDKIKFQCFNCSKSSRSPKGKPTTDETNSVSVKEIHVKVYPEKEKTMRCNICSESITVSEFVKHQLQRHFSKQYNCKHCSSSFSRRSLLKLHASRHT